MPIDECEYQHGGQIFDVERSEATPAIHPTCLECDSVEAEAPVVPTCGMECASGKPCGCPVPGFA